MTNEETFTTTDRLLASDNKTTAIVAAMLNAGGP